MPATEEFNVLTHFLEQWDWVIDAYRSYLNANFPRSTTLTLCAVTFLTMAEMMRLRYARHLPLQVGLNRGVGYSLFKFLSAIPIFGVSAIRLIEIFTLSRSIGLTVCVAVISMMPAEVPHTARSLFRRARSWVTISEREEVDGVDPTLLPEQTDLREDHFTSTQVKWVLCWQRPPELTSLLG
ncbi:hypothetical protein SCLCIDRAFT_489267 [Scleroderma citrinum Foug A]|uniref:Uncharacterized protein n=1 Tax=Scleroderma citrinum Foug A TaxID=1036808 RepID=A0A0C3D9H9_9AGAM|nr:hypothetical protein SCLCIDRAFT_489267 [Scleroderma citrinum Foug A]